jgi:hypothetical protein
MYWTAEKPEEYTPAVIGAFRDRRMREVWGGLWDE